MYAGGIQELEIAGSNLRENTALQTTATAVDYDRIPPKVNGWEWDLQRRRRRNMDRARVRVREREREREICRGRNQSWGCCTQNPVLV